MDKILQRVGRFLGEKFALIDRIYVKKGDVLPKSGSMPINGFVDKLPPRPVKGDCYMIQPGNDVLYKGIYYLNFGRNHRMADEFKITGDATAIATGSERWATTTGNGVETGFIGVEAGQDLSVYVGVKKLADLSAMNIIVEEYGGDNGLIRSSPCSLTYYDSAIHRITGSTTQIKIKVKGSVSIGYIKVWQAGGRTEYDKIYRSTVNGWVKEAIPQGARLGVKGKSFVLVNESGKIRQVETMRLPSLDVYVGVIMSPEKQVRLRTSFVNDGYVVRIFAKKRRMCKRVDKSIVVKNKYFECRFPRRHRWEEVRWIQPSPVVFSRKEVTTAGEVAELPFTWQELVNLIFVKGSTIVGSNGFTGDKYYPSTGLAPSSFRIQGEEGDYADVGLCLSKRINRRWVNGEMCYLRIAQSKRIDMMNRVAVRRL